MIRLEKILLIFFISGITLWGQSQSDYEIVNSLVDESVNLITESVPPVREISFEFNSPPELRRFKNRVIYALKKNGVEIFENNADIAHLNYALDNVSVSFSDAFRESFLGSYKSERTVKLSGNYFISDKGKILVSNVFLLSKKDTLDYDDITGYDNNGFSFLKTRKPEVPFFGSLLEPVIALGTVAIAIFLFFSVRSN